MTSTPELLPCPFCGGKAQISRAHQNKMLAMGEVATDEHYLFTLHHTCNPALNDGVTVCWTYKPKAVLVAAWNRRAPTPVSSDMREVVARALVVAAGADIVASDNHWPETAAQYYTMCEKYPTYAASRGLVTDAFRNADAAIAAALAAAGDA